MKHYSWISDIKAMGWDLDGTLYPPDSIPSETIQEKQYQAIMKANNWHKDQTKEEFKKVYANLGSHTKTLTTLGVNGNNFFTDLWDKLPLKEYIKHDQKIINLFAQIPIKKHFLVTNSNTKTQVKNKLKLIGLPLSIFEVIITTDKLDAVKPDPKPFMEALRLMGLTPNQTIFIGDRVTTDIRGAKNVGMKTCLVWSDSQEADISLKNVYQVSQLFEN